MHLAVVRCKMKPIFKVLVIFIPHAKKLFSPCFQNESCAGKRRKGISVNINKKREEQHLAEKANMLERKR
jgi:hypothetical protein